MKRLGRVVGIGILVMLGLLAVALAAIAIDNRSLPTQSAVAERLSPAEKARLAEVQHLRRTLGETVWLGWGQADIPLIVFNEAYVFLLDHPSPAPGWVKAPRFEQEGGLWQAVPDDNFQGALYYRQPIPATGETPENFVVKVDDRWVATLFTKEYSRIAFVNGVGKDLPGWLRTIFPFRLVWGFLGGDTEIYLGALAHETFHAFQATTALDRLAAAESAARRDDGYPWGNQLSEQSWQEELTLLHQAILVETETEARTLAQQFLAARANRRQVIELSPEQVDYERQREWLEGLAKYAELSLLRQAYDSPTYVPVDAVLSDPDFEKYTGMGRYWQQQMEEIKRMTGRSSETRFYYSGMAQALLLDRLRPGWKAQALAPDIWLEQLLAEVVTPIGSNE